MPEVEISLVVGSLFRPEPLERLLVSLEAQSFRSFEVIIVEQADRVAVEQLVARFPSLDVTVVECERGLSRARNVGLRLARGRLVGIPDDDCWYEPGTLQRVHDRFDEDPKLSILLGRVETDTGTMLEYPLAACVVDRVSAWRTAVSPGVFLRREVIDLVGDFDERLGVGSGTPAGSAEETELVLRGLAAGLRAEYDPRLHVSHPSPQAVAGRLSVTTGERYGFGMGVVVRRFGPRTFAATMLVRPLLGAVVALLRGDRTLATFRMYVVRGRWAGYWRGLGSDGGAA
ncbi:glycosyltransferase family 2 protein [Sanguibacter massiliensis]|uniref:glycosyltransferase family 2 protein n=1 Tax=Sanguibacter massiliensis TaxID=1973217 RepID=UPI0013EB478B|nr:glycosyltransferase [Sanguibacter massiliensis]